MFEKVNPAHPDKIADRIAGSIVDLAYSLEKDPKIAVEVLIGHGICHIIAETDVPLHLHKDKVRDIVHRIGGRVAVDFVVVPQDRELAENQRDGIRCGDNGIFYGVPIRKEQEELTAVAKRLYDKYQSDGKYIIDRDLKMIVCQSNAKFLSLREDVDAGMFHVELVKINPLGEWSGGIDVDTGATNRKLGSDMGDAVSGGGLHGKDLSKADVSVNIYAHLKAQETGKPVQLYCAIGDEWIDGKHYSEIVEIARKYIEDIGGFERFAEWGLIRP